MTNSDLDTRVHAYRPDLADISLQGKVTADRFVEGRPARVVVPVAGLYRGASVDAALDSQAVRGDHVTIFEDGDGSRKWVQLGHDGYVGWMNADTLGENIPEPTHRVCVSRTLLFSEPDIKSPLLEILPLGASVRIVSEARDNNADYALIEPRGAIVMQHLCPVDEPMADFVAVAELLMGTPYLWGGCSAFGIDCSGLVQVAMRMTGRDVARDSDLLEESVGTLHSAGSELPGFRRGDLVFWKAHLGIMRDETNLLHANAHHMAVAIEPLQEAVARISASGLEVTSVKRP